MGHHPLSTHKTNAEVSVVVTQHLQGKNKRCNIKSFINPVGIFFISFLIHLNFKEKYNKKQADIRNYEKLFKIIKKADKVYKLIK